MSYPFAIRPTKPRFIPTLDSFDILNRSSGEWYAIAAECGIDGQKLHGLINSTQTTYKRGIELEKKYKGSVWAAVNLETARNGQQYPVMTFSTPKHGGVKKTFNGYQWLIDNGHVGKKDTIARPSSATPKAEPVKTGNREQDFLNGLTVVANRTGGKKSKDIELINLAESQNKLVYCGRRVYSIAASKWLNPFKATEHTATEHNRVIEQYKAYLQTKPELLAAIHELKGKVLTCWCAPLPCHCDHLAELANSVQSEPSQPKFKPVQTIAARACVVCKSEFIPPFKNSIHCGYCYTLSKFNETQKHFNRLKPIEHTSRLTFEYRGVAGIVATLNKSYLAKKGFSIDDVKASGLDVRRGRDIRGAFVMVQAISGEKITGYQKIYDSKFIGYDGAARDKDFIFFPKKDSVTGEVKTYKTGSYVVLGSLDNAGAGLYFAEGLATGLSVFKATGKTTIVCFDAGGLMAVVNHFSILGYTKRYIAADNDFHADNSGNTGIYSALRVAESLKARVFVPTDTDSAGNLIKCDFNDLMQSKGIETVALQLRTHLNPNEVKPSRENLFKYCPEPQLKALAEKLCLSAAGSISTKAEFKSHSKALQNLFNGRGFTEFKARKYIFSILKGRVQFMQESNCFSGREFVTRIDVKGLSPEQIAAKVATLKGLVIDNRGMGGFKTEGMRLIAERIKTAPKPLPRPKNYTLTDNERRAYFLTTGGVTIQDWQHLTVNANDFAIWRGFNDDKVRAWLKVAPEPEPVKNHSIVAIAHRTSLIDSLSTRLGLPHYDRVNTFSPEHLAVCVNSIVKFEGVKPTVLFIDEFRQTLEHLHNGTVDNRISVNNQLIEWINGAGLVIAADADFNQASLEWILTNCPTMPIYWLDNGKQQSNGKTIELLEGNQFVINDLIGNAVIKAQAGGRVWLAFDGITQAKKAYQNFIAAGIAADKILLVHSENKADLREAEFLDNPNEVSEKYQVIIHTPVISSGVSITKEFDFVGAGFCGVLPPNELLQTVARVRTAKNITVALMPSNDHSRFVNVQNLIDGESTKRGRYCEQTGSLTLTSFDKFRLKQIATTNKALNNYEQYFKLLAQLKGYTLHDSGAGGVELLVSTKDVKAIVCSEILADNANLTESEFKALDKKTATTQAESNAIAKYQTKGMAGKAYTDLTAEDVYFFKYDNGLSKVKNAELVNADIAELKEHDKANHETRQKLSSETSKAFLFSYVINALSGKAVKRDLIRHCLDFLKANSNESAANELRNTRDLFKFVERAGYELITAGQETTGGRDKIFKLQLNPLVAEYLANRARLKSEAKEQTESDLMPEFEL